MNRSPVTIAVAVRKLLNDLTYPEKIEDLVNGLTENLRLGHTGSFVNQHCGAGAAVLVTTVGSYDVLRSQIGLGEGKGHSRLHCVHAPRCHRPRTSQPEGLLH